MKILGSVSEDQVLECFVRGELASPRYGEQVARLLEKHPEDPAVVLAEHRSWGRNEGLFDGFPADVEWCRARLMADELLEVRYINWDWWLRISGGTRKPRDAAARIRAGLVEGVAPDKGDERIAKSAAANPLLIVVREPDGPLVLLEGHVRLTAYALFPEHLPPDLEIYLGQSNEMAQWSEY